MVWISPFFFVYAAFLILALPLDWLLAAVTAAIVHELFHLLAVVLCGGRVIGIRIGGAGAQIHSRLPSRQREILATLAGPAGSLLIALLCRDVPRLAVCAGIQGIFNLLPIRPLDGGNALYFLLEAVMPRWADLWSKLIGAAAVIWILGSAVVFIWGWKWEILTALVGIGWICWGLWRNRPCNASQIRVQ